MKTTLFEVWSELIRANKWIGANNRWVKWCIFNQVDVVLEHYLIIWSHKITEMCNRLCMLIYTNISCWNPGEKLCIMQCRFNICSFKKKDQPGYRKRIQRWYKINTDTKTLRVKDKTSVEMYRKDRSCTRPSCKISSQDIWCFTVYIWGTKRYLFPSGLIIGLDSDAVLKLWT